MKTRDKLLSCLRALSADKPIAQISAGDVARQACCSVSTVRRYLGVAENFPLLIPSEVKPDTRSRILTSAAKVFALKGYMGASLDEVATDAGLTKGAIYWHFRSKSDLFSALIDHRFKRHTANIPAEVTSAEFNADPKVGLSRLLFRVIENLETEPEWPLLYIEFMGQARDPEILFRLRSLYQESYQFSENIVEIQKRLNQSNSQIDSRVMAIFWSSLLDGLVLAWFINGNELDFRTLTEKMVELLWNGVAPK